MGWWFFSFPLFFRYKFKCIFFYFSFIILQRITWTFWFGWCFKNTPMANKIHFKLTQKSLQSDTTTCSYFCICTLASPSPSPSSFSCRHISVLYQNSKTAASYCNLLNLLKRLISGQSSSPSFLFIFRCTCDNWLFTSICFFKFYTLFFY